MSEIQRNGTGLSGEYFVAPDFLGEGSALGLLWETLNQSIFLPEKMANNLLFKLKQFTGYSAPYWIFVTFGETKDAFIKIVKENHALGAIYWREIIIHYWIENSSPKVGKNPKLVSPFRAKLYANLIGERLPKLSLSL
jgi:hypothetical protein